MLYKDYDILDLIYNTGTGEVLVPDQLILLYRLARPFQGYPEITVFGWRHGDTTPTILCFEHALPNSTCNREPDMVYVLKLLQKPQTLAMKVRINPISYLSEVYSIKAVYANAPLKRGTTATDGTFDCG